MIIHTCPVGPFQMNCYIVADEATREGVVIDPGDEIPALLELIRRDGLKIQAILLTHGHIDHVLHSQDLKEALGVKMYAHPDDVPMIQAAPQQAAFFGLPPGRVPVVDGSLQEGTPFQAGPLTFQVLHTPGHSPGGVTLVTGGVAFVGDAVFAGSIGRTDLPGCDHQALTTAIRNKIYALPEETVLYPGHGPSTTVGEEKRTNPFVRAFGV